MDRLIDTTGTAGTAGVKPPTPTINRVYKGLFSDTLS